MRMLGARSRVVIDRPCGSRDENGILLPFDIGHLIDTKYPEQKRLKTILLGQHGKAQPIKSRVIGILHHPERESIFIAAPVNVSLYEPELRQILDEYMDTDEYHLVCHFEKSCGAVVFRRKSGNIEYLLIKNKKGNNWGFPKGHIELGETETETAIREVYEETGLKITPVTGFRVVSEYHPKGKVTKQVVFFLAELPSPTEEIHLQESEVERFIWADFGLAQKTFRFNNDRNVLSKARDWLSGRR